MSQTWTTLSLNEVAVSCWSLSQLLISSHFTVIQLSCWIFVCLKFIFALFITEKLQWVFFIPCNSCKLQCLDYPSLVIEMYWLLCQIWVFWTQSQDALQTCRGQQHVKSWWGVCTRLYKSKESQKTQKLTLILCAYFWPGDVESSSSFPECFLSLGGIHHAGGTTARWKSNR